MQIEIYKSRKNGQFAWRMKSRNGRKVACGGETYHNKKDVFKVLKSIFGITSSNITYKDLTLKK